MLYIFFFFFEKRHWICYISCVNCPIHLNILLIVYKIRGSLCVLGYIIHVRSVMKYTSFKKILEPVCVCVYGEGGIKFSFQQKQNLTDYSIIVAAWIHLWGYIYMYPLNDICKNFNFNFIIISPKRWVTQKLLVQ